MNKLQTFLIKYYSQSLVVKYMLICSLNKIDKRNYIYFLNELDKHRVNEYILIKKWFIERLFNSNISTLRWMAFYMMNVKERLYVRKELHKHFLKKYNGKYRIDESKSTSEQVKQMYIEERWYKLHG